MFTIEIPKLNPDGEWFEGEVPVSSLEVAGGNVRLEQPIRYRMWAQSVSGRLVVKGAWTLDLRLECGRCADFFSTTLGDSSFLRDYEISGGVETVDVTPDIREDVLLALPAYPVCGEACRGLCPTCGKNLNGGPCGCPPSGGVHWGGLDGLKLT
jgi:uncharacterized protein